MDQRAVEGRDEGGAQGAARTGQRTPERRLRAGGDRTSLPTGSWRYPLIEAPALRLPGTGPGRCATLPSARLAPPTALSLQQTWQSFQRLRPVRRASLR